MPKPYDATLKYLVERHPEAWPAFLGLPTAEVQVVEAELSTVTASADKVLRLQTAPASLLHIEFQSGYEERLDKRVLRYNVLLDYEHEETVESAVILLSPAAERTRISGRVQRRSADGRRLLDFTYRVIRVWEQPVEAILTGPLGALPLAPLADVAAEALPGVIDRMQERIREETTPNDAAELWTGTYVLMGLRYPRELSGQLLRGVRGMKESVTYMEIFEEGEAKGQAIGEARGEAIGEARGEAIGQAIGERNMILRQGRKRFGEPDAATIATLEAIVSIERLEQLGERLLEVESWTDLLAGA
jgi:predicted transposase YdaD